MPIKPTKPIAILACKYSQGMDWARENLQLREINGARRRVVDTSGQVYYVCAQIDDLRGYEFADIRVVSGLGDHPDYNEFMNYALLRVK